VDDRWFSIGSINSTSAAPTGQGAERRVRGPGTRRTHAAEPGGDAGRLRPITEEQAAAQRGGRYLFYYLLFSWGDDEPSLPARVELIGFLGPLVCLSGLGQNKPWFGGMYTQTSGYSAETGLPAAAWFGAGLFIEPLSFQPSTPPFSAGLLLPAAPLQASAARLQISAALTVYDFELPLLKTHLLRRPALEPAVGLNISWAWHTEHELVAAGRAAAHPGWRRGVQLGGASFFPRGGAWCCQGETVPV